jgi:putative SOS response-associated peptidase YedK
MCGRFDLTASLGAVAAAFHAEPPEGLSLKPRYNIAPAQETVIVLGGGNVPRQLVSARFGLRPDWWTVAGRDLINVRTELLDEKPYFRKQVETRRCLIPATGFFEWRHEGRRKSPFRFLTRADGLLAMAGLFQVSDFGFRLSYSFAVLTCPANEIVSPVHDRMPVLLNEEGTALWLSSSADVKELRPCLSPAPEDYLRAYQVSSLVNDARIDRPELIEPFNE